MFSFNLPPKVHSPRSIPLHHLDECMKAFKGYVEAGIMKTKTDNVISDFKKFNKIVKTTPTTFPSSNDIIARIPSYAKVH